MPCSEGRPALCEPGAAANGAGTLLSGARRLAQPDGAPINHHLGCSAFAEHAVVSRRSLVKLDPALPFDEAALFGCAVLTGVGAVVNTAQVRAGQSVAVIGLGGVGLAAVLGALAAGAREMVAVDLSRREARDGARASARRTGLRRRRSRVRREDPRRDAGRPRPSCSSSPAPSARSRLAYRITRRGGTTVTAGLPPPHATFALPVVNLVAEERTVKGSYIGTCVPTRDLPRYVSLYRSGRMPVDRLMSGRLTLDQINEGFDLLHEGKAIRQVVVFP